MKHNKLVYVLVGAALGIALKLFAFDVLRVAGKSMEPALREGDTVIVNKLAYGLVKPTSREFFCQWKTPERGDIVIFLHEDKIVVKRCVAIGGDRLTYFADNKYMVVGENKIELTESEFAQFRNIERVTDGYFFAVGDNHADSIDSRNYGFVSVRNVIGKVIFK